MCDGNSVALYTWIWLSEHRHSDLKWLLQIETKGLIHQLEDMVHWSHMEVRFKISVLTRLKSHMKSLVICRAQKMSKAPSKAETHTRRNKSWKTTCHWLGKDKCGWELNLSKQDCMLKLKKCRHWRSALYADRSVIRYYLFSYSEWSHTDISSTREHWHYEIHQPLWNTSRKMQKRKKKITNHRN